MFDMKNDNMDELFRNAAENYEVDTHKASNWDAVNKALQSTDIAAVEDKREKKKKRRFFFWWLLLLPAAWIGYNAWEKIKQGQQHTSNTQVNSINTFEKEGGDADDNINKNIEQHRKTGNSINKKNITTNNLPVNIIEHNSSDKKKTSDTGTGLNNNKGKGNSKIYSANTAENGNPEKNKYNKKAGRNKKATNENNQNNLFVVDKENDITGSLQYVFVESNGKALPEISFDKIILNDAPGIGDTSRNIQTDSTLQQRKNERQQHYLYVAAVASPDFSSVKFQRLSGAGGSIGLLLGYRINNRWHIETGAMWEKKVYYTKGKYFDKSKLSDYYRYVEILSVDGSCHMITIPVNVRYNVYAGKKTNWFVAGGMSSYLMNGEYYDYTYRHSGGQPITKGYKYKTTEKNWMTAINVSAGYEKTFLRSFNLRLEPYFRIPVAGVGTGNLSLTSYGIYIGIGKRF